MPPTRQGISHAALKVLLAFIYEGACAIEEGLLTEVLEASARLVVDPLKDACVHAIGARLAPSNALNVWRLADTFTLPALEKAAVEAALRAASRSCLRSWRGARRCLRWCRRTGWRLRT